MKTILLLIMSTILLTLSINAQTTYTVDGGHSSIVFSIGYKFSEFYGSFGEMEGKAVMEDENDFSTAKVDFSVQIASINTNSKRRDGHLQSERYLNQENFAQATFKSIHIKSLANDKYEMTGELTIAGKTLSQTVDVKILGKGEIGKGNEVSSIMGVKATFSFNRSNFGIMGGIPTMSDKVDIVVSLHMIKEGS
ncbi:MAG: YceI family protein [Saprospiraceae bacterium]|nr:YceI family protein [Saprospiraceae bacterium]